MKRLLISFLSILVCCLQSTGADTIHEADICVYGGTASGVAAGLAAARRGNSVIIVEPFRHLGGMHGGGIRIQQDCLYLEDIGGIARELHDADYALPGGGSANQWQARLMIKKKVEDAGIQYFTEHRLDSKDDVVTDGSTIRMIHLNHAPIMDEGVPPPQPARRSVLSVKAAVFIDASYEGDLMAFAGCAYTVARESRDTYGESLAGQCNLRYFDVDPYVVPGDSSSGVLPMISTEPYKPGEASRYMITYNFRLKGMRERASDEEQATPLGSLGREIDRERYALVIRGLEKDSNNSVIGWPAWNYKRTTMVSSGVPGRQADYPDGDWAERGAVWRDWIDHVKTMNILCGIENPVLPDGEYPDNGNFPDQLYIRLGRRMIGEYVVTQNDLMHQTVLDDSIGLAYYAVDIYPTRLIAHQGKVASEGELFVRVSPGPYQIPYRALIPRKGDCANLIIPVCMSASHIALSSIRMESTYVVMGEAAGVAASHAVKSGRSVQDVDAKAICADLRKAGAVTEWDGKGYGPHSKKTWSADAIHWLSHPEEYKKIPIRLDPGWEGYDPSAGGVRVEAFPSVEDWNRKKPGHKWLFPFIDKNADGKISKEEHQAFQDYKKKHRDWATILKSTLMRSGTAEEAWRKLTGTEKKTLRNPAYDFVGNVPDLPNVFIYGDSISVAYTPVVRDELAGKANVYRLHRNGGATDRVIDSMTKMHQVMGDHWPFTWDVIHFNVGLHDLKYTSYDTVNGTPVRSPEEYQKNLREIIEYFRRLAPKAKLIFATTTPVPENSRGRKAGDAARFNQAALEVLKDFPGIVVNDLYTLSKSNYEHWRTSPGNVHYNQKGATAQGKQVAREILRALGK